MRPSSDIVLRPRQVHTITDRLEMVNTYVINTDPIIVVDPSSELNVQLLCLYLERFLHRSLTEIGLVVLTHVRSDALVGLQTLLQRCNASVAASSAIPQLIQQESWREQKMFSQTASQGLPCTFRHLERSPALYEAYVSLVDIWLDDVAGLPMNPDWRVLAYPGFTPDSICLYNPFTAEFLSGNAIIAIERRRLALREGSNRVLLGETLLTLQSLRIHYVYPGHGRPVIGRYPLKHISAGW